MKNCIDMTDFKKKEIRELGGDFSGTNRKGETISFTNYYMEKNGVPFFGVSGEFHFSRMEECRWEDEIAKMKMGGINVIATYVFWNHHEEEEGIFNFQGRFNVRRFIELCQKYEIYVILRVGPFDHGEVRNGGIPDWMYGKPYEMRQLNEGFLAKTRCLYQHIAKEVEGLFYQDGGPIIGTQIDNEYMHSSSPWENTTGISNEWVFGGNEGDAYMLRLKELAWECGLRPVFYTCTGWGGAPTPDSMLPLWGGYAFQPWLFYSYQGEHPSTKEYLYQDLHNNEIQGSYNFDPHYAPEERPYACCEMGGGMMCSYYYRFILPYKSVDAMANIKLASGCNFLGYYVFQGGSNPVGKNGVFLNEGQVPKISYDYQACLGEFGQVRESYLRLKTLHLFVERYATELCKLKTMLPQGASEIEPKDLDTLRYAVRTDGYRGFLFLNNYQDHQRMTDKKGETVELLLPKETICFEPISIAGDENCILPFHFELNGMDLVKATAQPITDLTIKGEQTYLFMRPEGMTASFLFEEGVTVCETGTNEYQMDDSSEMVSFRVEKGERCCRVFCISRELSNQLYVLDEGFVFSSQAVYQRGDGLFVEGQENETVLTAYPVDLLSGHTGQKFTCRTARVEIRPQVKQVAQHRYTVTFPAQFLQGAKDAILKIRYRGDIGHAFINGQMVHDNFCNGDTWEIGLRTFAEALEKDPLTIYITPLKKGVNVNVESTMAARLEEVAEEIGELDELWVDPVYEMQL